jgi:hypothetical protein
VANSDDLRKRLVALLGDEVAARTIIRRITMAGVSQSWAVAAESPDTIVFERKLGHPLRRVLSLHALASDEWPADRLADDIQRVETDPDACPECGAHAEAMFSQAIGAGTPPTGARGGQRVTCPQCGVTLRRVAGAGRWQVSPA